MDQDYAAAEAEDQVLLQQQQDDHKTRHWTRRPLVLLVCIVVFLLTFGTTLGELVRQVITYKLACAGLGLKHGVCDAKQAQMVVSNLQMGYLMCMGGIGSMAAAKVGPLLDQYGRRKVLIGVLLFLVLGRTCKFLVMTSYDKLNFPLMIALEVITNLGGGPIGTITIVNCYISDVVPAADRIFSLGFSIAGLFIGASLGPVAGNLILKWVQGDSANISTGLMDQVVEKLTFIPLRFELGVLYMAVLYVVLWLPELRSKANRTKARTNSRTNYGTLSRLDSFVLEALAESVAVSEEFQPWYHRAKGHMNPFSALRVLWIPREFRPAQTIKRDRVVVVWLIICDIVMTVFSMSAMEIYILYGLYRFQWTSLDIGHLLAAICASKALVLLVVLPLLNKKVFPRIGLRPNKNQYDFIDFILVFVGISVDALAFTMLYFADSTNQFFAVLIVTLAGVLALPAINSSVIKFYPSLKIGEVFGALSVLKTLATFVGPLTFLSIYKFSLAQFDNPGLVFFFFAFGFGFCALSQIPIRRMMHF